MLTTTNVGTILPQFTEEYGSGKKIDIVLTPSHQFFIDAFPKSKMTGIYIDKNGNWKFQVNFAMQLNVEHLPGMWEPVRNIYVTAVFKMKLSQSEENGEKLIHFTPKNVELTQLKVLKNEESIDMEQMMLQSLANI